MNCGTAVDATLIATPSSTKNQGKQRDPEMSFPSKLRLPRVTYKTLLWKAEDEDDEAGI